MTTHALACKGRSQALEPFEYEEAPLSASDVEIAISHCGICYSDVHLIENELGVETKYPLVPGHEIIGTITAKGKDVRDLEIGQRVGVGWQRSACLTCDLCVSARDNLCGRAEATCVNHYGGFADKIRTDCHFAFAIPDKLASENAAPLLCGGATVFSPLKIFDVKPWMRVGVIGVGGLGHLAVQFSAAMGCEVVALSHSRNKEAEAKALGASAFLSSTDASDLRQWANAFDVLLSTVTATLDWPQMIALLRPGGTFCFLGIVDKPIEVPVWPLVVGNRRIVGSPIAGRMSMREMLHFAAQHGVVAKTELFPMAEANAALDKVRKNEVRYRAVLKS